MSRGQTLRALVKERLAAAAEDIFVLFERTIAAYEEELRCFKEENQRKQQLSEKTRGPMIELVRGNCQIPWTSPGLGLNQEIKEELEEQIIKQEKEQLPVPVPESSAVCVKTEESSLLKQRQTELQEETQGEDISSEPCFYSETEGHTEHSSDTDNDDDWEPFNYSAAQMETEADHYNQVQTRDRCTKLSPQNRSAPETTVHSEHMSGAHGGAADRKKHQCPFCHKTFTFKSSLQMHVRVHTGEKPYSCAVCKKRFSQKSNLDSHEKIHNGKKLYSCSVCDKTFIKQINLNRHQRTHTGERPFSCSICEKSFAQKGDLVSHTRTHTGEKPYSCSNCGKHFANQSNLKRHEIIHTGERPYSCSICNKTFTYKSNLDVHAKKHISDNISEKHSA